MTISSTLNGVLDREQKSFNESISPKVVEMNAVITGNVFTGQRGALMLAVPQDFTNWRDVMKMALGSLSTWNSA